MAPNKVLQTNKNLFKDGEKDNKKTNNLLKESKKIKISTSSIKHKNYAFDLFNVSIMSLIIFLLLFLFQQKICSFFELGLKKIGIFYLLLSTNFNFNVG
jgi:hypothetical protein